MKVKPLARATSRSPHQAGNKSRPLWSSPQWRLAHERESTMSGDITTAVLERAESHAKMIPAYTVTARVLHWTTAFLILFMIPLGIVIANDWGGAAQNFLYDLHRSIGVTVIPLVILRIIYRWRHPPLPLPEDIVPMQRFAAETTHWALYALLVVQPFTGWIATSAYRGPVVVFGWFELPPIWAPDRAFS